MQVKSDSIIVCSSHSDEEVHTVAEQSKEDEAWTRFAEVHYSTIPANHHMQPAHIHGSLQVVDTGVVAVVGSHME